MKFIIIFFLIYLINFIKTENLIPTSVKLSLTGNNNEYRLTWLTESESKSPVVILSNEYIENPSQQNVIAFKGKSESFETIGWKGHPNSVVVTEIQDFTKYYYIVGDSEANTFSGCYNFTSANISNNQEVSTFQFIIYGDMGAIYNAPTVANILPLVESNQIDLIIHAGDIAYADEKGISIVDGNETIWNEFLQSIECLTSQVPYMTVPGNHDIFIDLAVYRKTFNMPSDLYIEDWYSFDYRGVHFVGISSESDYFPYSIQHQWLEKDLKSYREKNPTGWIIAYAHRPIYCSSSWSWCTTSLLRKEFQKSIETLFYKYNVDLYISGHAHNYERTLPVYQSMVQGDYSNPKSFIQIVSGGGGNVEGQLHTFIPAPVWSTGVRSSDTGFGMVEVVNSTHLLWKFIDNQSNSILDSEYIVKGQFN